MGQLEDRSVALEQPDFDGAELALVWASIVYGAFLTACRSVIPQRAGEIALERLREYTEQYGEPTAEGEAKP